MPRRERLADLAVLLAILLLFLFRLGANGLFDPDEGRYAAASANMNRSGDYVVPSLQGFPYLEKPPVTYWATAASFALFGENEFAARLPMALFGFGGVLVVFLLTRRLRGAVEARLAALLVALSAEWFAEARFLTTDMPLAAFMTAALAAFWCGVETGRRRWYFAFWALVAGATLCKGIIGFLLPGGIVFWFIVLSRRWRLFREMQLVPGALLFTALVVPWFWAVQARFGEFLHWFVVDQHLARYVAEKAEHEKAFWFFVPVVLGGFFPWIIYLFALRRRDRDAAPDPPGGRAGQRDFRLYLWLWFGVIFLFFSAGKGKLISYVLPLYPPLAMLVTQVLGRAWTGPGDAARRVRAASLAIGAVFLVLAPLAWLGLSRAIRRDGRLDMDALWIYPAAFGVVFLAAGLATLALAAARRLRAAFAVQAVAMAATFFVLLQAIVAAEPLTGARPLVRALGRELKAGDLVVLHRLPQPSVEFYLHRTPTLVAFAGEYRFGMRIAPRPGLFFDDPAAIDALLAQPRTVFAIVDNDDTDLLPRVPRANIVARNLKRTVIRNGPEPIP